MDGTYKTSRTCPKQFDRRDIQLGIVDLVVEKK